MGINVNLDQSQLTRLSRDDWNALGPQALAEELQTMFKGNVVRPATAGPSVVNIINQSQQGVPGAPGAAGTPGATGQAAAAAGAVGPGNFVSGEDGTVLNLFSTGDDLSIRLNFGDGSTGDITIGDIGVQFNIPSVSIGGLNFPSTQTVPVKDGKIQIPAADAVFMGTVVSGSGDTYQVTIYPNGRSQPGQTVTATVPQIATGETVPAGTAVLVIQTGFNALSGTTYEFQPCVWL